MLCNQIFGKRPHKLSKFYGTYYHALTTHLPEVNRMIAPSSLHTESEERIFSSIRGIVRSTSSRTMESIRDVGIVRYVKYKSSCRQTFETGLYNLLCLTFNWIYIYVILIYISPDSKLRNFSKR